MDVSLSIAQDDFLHSNKPNNGLVAGLGSGKSYIATLKCIIKKLEYPDLTVAYYLPNYGLIRDIAFDKFPTMLSDMGIEYKLNKSDKEIHIAGAGKIIFRSMDTPETIVGFEVFYSMIDECDILPMEKMETAYNKILARNRQKAPVTNQLDIVGTPEGYKFFYKRFVEELESDSDALFQSSTYSNIDNLPIDYIDKLKKQYTKELLDAYLEGKFVNLTKGTVYKYFNRQIHNSTYKDDGRSPIEIGQDFNVGGCVSIVYQEYQGNDIAIDEFESYDTARIIDNIKAKYPNRVIKIYPDASGNARKTSATTTDIQMLRQAGFQVYVNSQNPRVKDRINITNNRFEKNRVLVNVEKCPKYAKALEQHSYDKNGEPDKISGAGTIDDYTDAGSYIIAYKHPIAQSITRVGMSGN